jgi:two-component system response regulator PhoP
MRLIVIEDDQALQNLLKDQLQQAGFEVDCCSDGQEGLYQAAEFSYDLAIIDIGLPKLSGMEVVKKLREQQKILPVLILTARSGWQDKVNGLNAGADDYMVKPFQTEELIARIHAMLRRSAGYAQNIVKQGPISLDLQSNEFSVNDCPIQLTAFEFKLAEYFITHPNKILPKTQLMDHLYNDYEDRDSNGIEVLIARLRQKLDPDNTIKPIETLRGRGYRFAVMGS